MATRFPNSGPRREGRAVGPGGLRVAHAACKADREEFVLDGLRERRLDPRTAFGGRVELNGVEGPRFGRACDLSRAGLGLRLPAPHPPLGTAFEAEFRLPGFVLPLLVAALVRWSRPGEERVGLAFAGLDPAVVELLDGFVAGRFHDG